MLEACVRRICYVWVNPTVYNLAPVRLGCTLSTMEWNNPSTWHNCCRDYGINCQVSSYQFFRTYYLRQLFLQPLLSNLTHKYFRIMTCNNNISKNIRNRWNPYSLISKQYLFSFLLCDTKWKYNQITQEIIFAVYFTELKLKVLSEILQHYIWFLLQHSFFSGLLEVL